MGQTAQEAQEGLRWAVRVEEGAHRWDEIRFVRATCQNLNEGGLACSIQANQSQFHLALEEETACATSVVSLIVSCCHRNQELRGRCKAEGTSGRW